MKGGLAVSLVRNMLKFAALFFLTGLACSLGGPAAPATALPTATFTQTETPTITLTASGTFTDVPAPAGNVAATVAIATNVTAATPTLFNAASGSTGGSTGGVAPTLFVPASATNAAPPTAAPIATLVAPTATNTTVPLPVINPAGSPPAGQCSVMVAPPNTFVNVRTAPGTNNPAIAILQSWAGVVGYSGTWTQISLPNGVGWVSNSVVIGAGTCAPTAVAVSTQCILTMTEPTLAYRHPDMTQVFGTLAAGESVEATARNVLGWYGFDPGIAQAGNVGLDRLRWLPAGTAAGHSIKASPGCATLTIVSYPEN